MLICYPHEMYAEFDSTFTEAGAPITLSRLSPYLNNRYMHHTATICDADPLPT